MDTHSNHNHHLNLTFELTPHIIEKQSLDPEILHFTLWGPAFSLQIKKWAIILQLSEHIFVLKT